MFLPIDRIWYDEYQLIIYTFVMFIQVAYVLDFEKVHLIIYTSRCLVFRTCKTDLPIKTEVENTKNRLLINKNIASRSATHKTIRKVSLVDLNLPRKNVYRPSIFNFPSSIIIRFWYQLGSYGTFLSQDMAILRTNDNIILKNRSRLEVWL